LIHRNGVREELHASVTGPWELRKALIRSYKLKSLKCDLFYRVEWGYQLARIPVYMKTVEEGDVLSSSSREKGGTSLTRRGRQKDITRNERIRRRRKERTLFGFHRRSKGRMLLSQCKLGHQVEGPESSEARSQIRVYCAAE
jgi:hypothetical protein